MTSIIDISGVNPDALNLRDMLEGILERVENVYASYNVPIPARRYWTMGMPAIDCEQLVVHFMQAYLGAPGAQDSTPNRCNIVRSATIAISIARQLPVVVTQGTKPPSPEKISAGSEISAVDAWVLLQSLNLFDMWEPQGVYGPGVIATVESGDPEGGFRVVTMQLTMAIP